MTSTPTGGAVAGSPRSPGYPPADPGRRLPALPSAASLSGPGPPAGDFDDRRHGTEPSQILTRLGPASQAAAGAVESPPAPTPEFRSGFIDQVFRSAYHVPSSAVSRRRSRRCSGRPADHLGDPHMHSQRGAKRCQWGLGLRGIVAWPAHRDTRLPTPVRVPSVAESLYLTDIRASPHREQQDRSCRNRVTVGNSTSTGSPDVGCPPAPRGSRRRGPGGFSGRTGLPVCA
jgi:hypothetical protein